MNADPRAAGNAMYSTDLWGTDVNAVLGQFFDDQLRRVYRTLTGDYCNRNKGTSRIRSTLEVMEIPQECSGKELHSRFKTNFAAVVDDVLLGAGKSFPMDKKALLLKHLPRDIPCSYLLEVYKVPENDPRIPLRGENGVRVTKTATKGLPAGAFIGIYRGRSLIGLQDYKDIKYAPPGVDFFQFELEIDSYTASAIHYNIGCEAEKHGITFDGLDPRDASYSSIHVCAARYGNITALVNDPSLDPMGNTTFETIGEDNTCLVEVIVGGWPCIVMFASKPINPGEELRYSYGVSFWDYMRGATKRLNEVRRNGNLAASGGGHGNLGGGAGDGGISAAFPATAGPLVDAATPMRSRNPHSQPSAVTPLPGINSDLAPTEEQHAGENDDNDGGDSHFGADSRKRKAREIEEDDDEEIQNDDEATPRRSRPQRRPKRIDESQDLPGEKPQQKPGPKKKKKKTIKRVEPGKTPLFTPTKEMMSSPHGQRVKLYSKKTELGKFQAENGYASIKQFEAVQRRVEENPEIESGGESEREERVDAPDLAAAERTKQHIVPEKRLLQVKNVHAKAERRAVPSNRAANKKKVAVVKDEAIALEKKTLESGNGNGGGGTQAAQPTTDEDSEINRLTAAVEAGKKAFKIAKDKFNSAGILVDRIKIMVAELQPEEERIAATPPMTAQSGDKPCLLWTKARIFALFREIEQGNERLVGPWDVSQLENALDLNQVPADTEVFVHPYLDRNDVEIQEALESLEPAPEGGMWKLAELLDAAHPEALAAEAETPLSAAAAATKNAAARKAKTKRMDPQQARQLNEKEKELKKALQQMEEREKLLQEKKEALALVRKELQRALGEDEDEEEVDPEVAKINERSAGKRPAVDNRPSGRGGDSNGANGNGHVRGLNSPPKFTAGEANGTGRTIGADGAGTSAAHAAAGAAKVAGKGGGVWAALNPPKTAIATPADDDVVDLTFDSD
jgi:hypothetical protein